MADTKKLYRIRVLCDETQVSYLGIAKLTLAEKHEVLAYLVDAQNSGSGNGIDDYDVELVSRCTVKFKTVMRELRESYKVDPEEDDDIDDEEDIETEEAQP